MNRGARWATVHGVTRSWAWLSSELQSYQWIRKEAAKGWRFARAEDGWMVSLTQWTWIWANSGRRWWTGKPGVLKFMGSRRVRYDWASEQHKCDVSSLLRFWEMIASCNPHLHQNKELSRHQFCTLGMLTDGLGCISVFLSAVWTSQSHLPQQLWFF